MRTTDATTKARPARKAVEVRENGQARSYEQEGSPVTFVPLTIKRRQSRALLIAPHGSATTVPNAFDLPLIKTLGKAFYWQRLIDTGEAFDANDIAAASSLIRAGSARCCA